MVNVMLVVGLTAVITFVGGGGGYLIWLATRPKKETWIARIYQLGSGVRKSKTDKISLSDLKPYAMDVLEKVIKKNGEFYRLVKLNKTTPAVESDCVDYWGENKREVNVLFEKSGCTLLRKGYDKVSGEIIFDPLNHSRVNLIKGEVAIKKDRLHKEKDILQAISPWIVAGILMFGLFGLTWLVVSGLVEISDNGLLAAEIMADGMKAIGSNNIFSGAGVIDVAGGVT